MFLQLKRTWGAIRWKMPTIFVFFSVISMILVGCFAVAVLNVVIRRESAYLLEERIKMVVDERKDLIDSVKDDVRPCPEPRMNSLHPIGYPDAVWPESQVSVLPWKLSATLGQAWHDAGDFAGVVADSTALGKRGTSASTTHICGWRGNQAFRRRSPGRHVSRRDISGTSA